MAPPPRHKQVLTKVQKLAKQGEVDVHLAAKVSQQLVAGVAHFKSKLQNFSFGPKMDHFFDWVPEQFINQQLPKEIQSFRTYLTRFHRGSTNSVLAFVKWVEWAQYENGKDKKWTVKRPKHDDGDEEEAADGEKTEEARKRPRSGARQEMLKTVQGREHMKALLTMCQRHNSTKRKEGIHSLTNHMAALTSELDTRIGSYEELKAAADPSVAYGLVRLVLGMVTDNFFGVVMNCHALNAVLSKTPISAAILLSLLDDEMALPQRMKAFHAHQRKLAAAREARNGEDDEKEDAAEDEFDPDALADPTRGERNQRMSAVLFAYIALLSTEKPLHIEEARRMAATLCYCYVEHRGLRVLAANVLLTMMKSFPQLLEKDAETWSWLKIAFFKFHRIEYIRPEGIQLLLFAAAHGYVPSNATGHTATWFRLDPLEPEVMEQIGSALFRREHVTECHPSIHPVWDNYFSLIAERCAKGGESIKVHLTNVVHNLIAPYRRGASDHPRALLFRKLLDKIAHLALLNADEFDRAEVVQVASKTVGLGRTKVGKVSDPATLRSMSMDEMFAKVHSLIRQYTSIKDSDPSANTSRTWIVRELRGCIAVEHRVGVHVPYINDVAKFFFTNGFLAPKSQDQRNMNRCIYTFADMLTFTFEPKHGGKCRPKANLDVVELMDQYLAAEVKGSVRYNTAAQNEQFGKAREKLEKVLRAPEKRSVLFYESKDITNMLFLLFLVTSIDDVTNSEAVSRVETIIPDLCRFYQKGNVESLAVFYDLMMALCASNNAPLQIMPLMSVIRRLASAFLVRFARFVKQRAPLDMVLAPLVEAFRTDEREALRLAAAEGGDDEEAEEADEKATKKGRKRVREEEDADDDDDEGDADSTDVDSDDEDSEEDEEDDDLNEEEESDEEAATVADSEADEEATEADDDSDDDGNSWAGVNSDGEFEEEDKPTDAYLNTLKHMVKDRSDPDHVYPTDTANRETADVLRVIQLGSRVGLHLRAPVVVNAFQVLLAVLRNTTKTAEDVIPDAARAAIEALLLSKNRYFGYFCSAADLEQILGDIQSYMRKTEKALLAEAKAKNRSLAIKGSLVHRRLLVVKRLSLSVMHYIGFLAQKNHASNEALTTIKEFWKTMFCERGWDNKRLLPHLKANMHHFRHGFAWCFVPAGLEKALSIKDDATAKRARVFIGTYALIEAFLPRLSGLPAELKKSVGSQIKAFFEAMTLKEVFEIQYTMLFHYFHCLRMTMEYNSKVALDVDWVRRIIAEATDDDSIQMTKACARQIATLEKLCNVTPRVINVKACTPFSVLHQQHPTNWRKKKAQFHKNVHKERKKTLRAVLNVRNEDPTEEERENKRQRREFLRRQDKNERQQVKDEWLQNLTKEEKVERRKQFKQAKQERIAQNKERKQRLHEKRKEGFKQWREKKLADAEADE